MTLSQLKTYVNTGQSHQLPCIKPMLIKHLDEGCAVEGGGRKVDRVFYFGPSPILSPFRDLIEGATSLRTKNSAASNRWRR